MITKNVNNILVIQTRTEFKESNSVYTVIYHNKLTFIFYYYLAALKYLDIQSKQIYGVYFIHERPY